MKHLASDANRVSEVLQVGVPPRGNGASFDAPQASLVRDFRPGKARAIARRQQKTAHHVVSAAARHEVRDANPDLLFIRRRNDYAANAERMQAARGHGQTPRALTTVTETPSADLLVDALRIKKISGWRTTVPAGT